MRARSSFFFFSVCVFSFRAASVCVRFVVCAVFSPLDSEERAMRSLLSLFWCSKLHIYIYIYFLAAARCSKLETKLKKKEEKKGGHTHTHFHRRKNRFWWWWSLLLFYTAKQPASFKKVSATVAKVSGSSSCGQ